MISLSSPNQTITTMALFQSWLHPWFDSFYMDSSKHLQDIQWPTFLVSVLFSLQVDWGRWTCIDQDNSVYAHRRRIATATDICKLQNKNIIHIHGSSVSPNFANSNHFTHSSEEVKTYSRLIYQNSMTSLSQIHVSHSFTMLHHDPKPNGTQLPAESARLA